MILPVNDICTACDKLCALDMQPVLMHTCTSMEGLSCWMCLLSASACLQPASVRCASSFTMPMLWKPSPCRTKWTTYTHNSPLSLMVRLPFSLQASEVWMSALQGYDLHRIVGLTRWQTAGTEAGLPTCTLQGIL